MWMELLNRYGREESNGNSSPSVKLKKLQNVNKTGKKNIEDSDVIRILPEMLKEYSCFHHDESSTFFLTF